MFCPQCGFDLGNQPTNFCQKCGKPSSQSQSDGSSFTATAAARAPERNTLPHSPPAPASHGGRYVLFAVLALVLLFAMWSIANSPNATRSNNEFIRQMATRQITQPVTVNIINGPIAIAPSQAMSYHFTVLPRSQYVQIEGSFEASGGSGNDVEVYVLDDDGFVNWQNGHSTTTFYNSGKVTRGTLNVVLPATSSQPVTYHVIFNNKFSLVSNKVVSGAIAAHFVRSL
jgi:hypothetical protein